MQSRELTNSDYFNQSNQIVNIISNITTILRNTEMHTYNLVNSSRRNNIGPVFLCCQIPVICTLECL